MKNLVQQGIYHTNGKNQYNFSLRHGDIGNVFAQCSRVAAEMNFSSFIIRSSASTTSFRFLQNRNIIDLNTTPYLTTPEALSQGKYYLTLGCAKYWEYFIYLSRIITNQLFYHRPILKLHLDAAITQSISFFFFYFLR